MWAASWEDLDGLAGTLLLPEAGVGVTGQPAEGPALHLDSAVGMAPGAEAAPLAWFSDGRGRGTGWAWPTALRAAGGEASSGQTGAQRASSQNAVGTSSQPERSDGVSWQPWEGAPHHQSLSFPSGRQGSYQPLTFRAKQV